METRDKKMKRLSIKQLESYLQHLDDFERPKIELEQYATPAHIAAVMLNSIDLTYDDIRDKFVADLGCGTGRLSVGSLLCGAKMVFGFDIDREALECGLQNVNEIFNDDDDDDDDVCDKKETINGAYKCCERFNFIQADLAAKGENCDLFWKPFKKKFDTVIMNPPFGTKQNQGLDMLFLKRATDLATDVVYSLHKTSTRDFITNRCQEWGLKGKPIAQIRYNLESTYKFHRKKSVDIDVDLWRIKCPT